MKTALLFVICCALSVAQQASPAPLKSLPYTPSLETQFMDRTVDPCVDFYKYSCGNWNKLNPMPADQARWNVYSKLTDDNQRYLWGILEDAAKPSAGRTPSQQRIGDYFGSCMDEAAVEKAGAAPLKHDLDAINALRSTRDLPKLLARLHLKTRGDSLLFGFGANQDFRDSSRVITFIVGGGLGLPDRDYYVKTDPKSEEIRTRYVAHVQKVFELLGDPPLAAAGEARTVMTIETALAKASLTRVEKRDPYKLVHIVTAAQLAALTPSFRWSDYLAASGAPPVTEFNVTEPAYMKEVEVLLHGQSIADWRAYLRWHLAHAEAPYLSDAFARSNFEFFAKYLHGVTEMPARWKRCVRMVDRDLGEALGQVFADKTFGPETKARTVAMTTEIEKAMEKEIAGLDWMSDATKKKAMDKLHSIVGKIGYPANWRDYTSLEVVPGDFAGNVSRAAEFESRRQLAKIGKPVNRDEWDMSPPTVNAYYNPQMNDINFPAGVLQPPLFDPKLDDAPNYGNTGATIGHELTHGFDDEGRQFDSKGDLKDWWTKDDADAFVKRVGCVADQYAQYKVIDDIRINSKLTLGEDVADLGGTLLAYIAWKSATSGQDLKSVDGFTPDQRFFIGMAQWACGDERAESKRANAITNPHSPEEYRINGVVSNMPEFGRAFSCQVGQPMVRAGACRVW